MLFKCFKKIVVVRKTCGIGYLSYGHIRGAEQFSGFLQPFFSDICGYAALCVWLYVLIQTCSADVEFTTEGFYGDWLIQVGCDVFVYGVEYPGS